MSMLKMVEAELKTEVREEVSNFLFLTQMSMVKMVEAEVKREGREELSNFLFT